ncbi:hypothetical protein AG0111_0g1703 [Alternaria gaisen]|uniref:Uncharacterized protein n=1 Tax=Alternaria gaisen TaxID=167740 RepID=A0ACB6G2J1_9PLEO|nr:hypothetical protein AG0111_0g1703 [Alternaria gaisen]
MTYWTQFWRWTSSLSTLPLRMEDIVRYLDKVYSGQSRGAALYGFKW